MRWMCLNTHNTYLEYSSSIVSLSVDIGLVLVHLELRPVVALVSHVDVDGGVARPASIISGYNRYLVDGDRLPVQLSLRVQLTW